jgi:hypothetical protein
MVFPAIGPEVNWQANTAVTWAPELPKLSEHGALTGPDKVGASVVPLSFPLVNLQAKTGLGARGATTPQTPPVQVALDSHAFPHCPQFCGSSERLTQVELQRICPDGQVCAVRQVAPIQVCPAEHAFPQKPQFAASVAGSLHPDGH